MKVEFATWNVNSLTQRADQVYAWLETNPVDVLVLEELKHTSDKLDNARWAALGYTCHVWGQKTYNGVAVFVKSSTFDVLNTMTGLETMADDQARLVGVTLQIKGNSTLTHPLEVWGAYVPNGSTRGSQKYFYKLDWLAALRDHLQRRLDVTPYVAVGGDFNIAPTDMDLYDPNVFKDDVLASSPERLFLTHLEHHGWTDAWRTLHPSLRQYSWWDYRQRGFENNHGVRIDHWFVSPGLTRYLHDARIDETPRGWPQPSDHTPVIMTLNCGV